MYKVLSCIYLVACLIFDSLGAGFFTITVFLFSVKRRVLDVDIAAAFAFVFIFLLAISLTGFLRVLDGKKKIIRCTLMMKMTLIPACFTGIYISIPVFTAALFFFVLTVICVILAIWYCRKVHKVTGTPVVIHAFTTYNAGIYWNNALAEYMRYQGIDKLPEKSPDTEKAEIVNNYASMPVIYLLKWLIDRQYMSEIFYEHVNGGWHTVNWDDITPLEFFRTEMGYIMYRDYVRGDVLGFLDGYFDVAEVSNLDTVWYGFDYYEAVGSSEGYYYCVEYSDAVYERLAEIFDRRYRNVSESTDHKAISRDQLDKEKLVRTKIKDDTVYVTADSCALFERAKVRARLYQVLNKDVIVTDEAFYADDQTVPKSLVVTAKAGQRVRFLQVIKVWE